VDQSQGKEGHGGARRGLVLREGENDQTIERKGLRLKTMTAKKSRPKKIDAVEGKSPTGKESRIRHKKEKKLKKGNECGL